MIRRLRAWWIARQESRFLDEEWWTAHDDSDEEESD